MAFAQPPKPALFSMHVAVRLEDGTRHTYDGLFAHTFDAYDDAMERFPTVARIVVMALPRREEVRHAA